MERESLGLLGACELGPFWSCKLMPPLSLLSSYLFLVHSFSHAFPTVLKNPSLQRVLNRV